MDEEGPLAEPAASGTGGRMNAATTSGRGPARLFADFSLLPDLLRHGNGNLRDVKKAWTDIVRNAGCNLGHVEDEDVPTGGSIDQALANDAFNLALRLRLAERRRQSDGTDAVRLTDAGRRIAEAASTPIGDRGEGHYRAVRDTLAKQIRACWLGTGGLDIAALLHNGALRLAETAHVWAGYCPGLLLVEFEALVCDAGAETGRAAQLVDELVGHRDHAMHRHDMPSPDVGPFQNLLLHADAVFDFYMNNLEYGDRLQMTVTEMRATAMLLTYSGLLEDGAPLGPVQYLTPSR